MNLLCILHAYAESINMTYLQLAIVAVPLNEEKLRWKFYKNAFSRKKPWCKLTEFK